MFDKVTVLSRCGAHKRVYSYLWINVFNSYNVNRSFICNHLTEKSEGYLRYCSKCMQEKLQNATAFPIFIFETISKFLYMQHSYKCHDCILLITKKCPFFLLHSRFWWYNSYILLQHWRFWRHTDPDFWRKFDRNRWWGRFRKSIVSREITTLR